MTFYNYQQRNSKSNKMSYKFYFSDITWRSELHQERCIGGQHPDWAMHQVYKNDERDEMLRSTTRASDNTIVVSSFANLANTEIGFTDFVKLCKKRGTWIKSIEENYIWQAKHPIIDAVRQWKIGKAAGAGRIGAKISADNKKAKSAEGIAKISKRWPLPSSEWSTAALLQEAGVSLNTAKAHLGKRPIAQYNYQAFLKRKLRKLQNAK